MAGTRKGTYKITNWSEYNESLVQRGSITFWFCERRLKNGTTMPIASQASFVYSDTAIGACLSWGCFNYAYRQTEDSAKSLVELMRIELVIQITSLASCAKLESRSV
jgi:Ni,Fe-hydrogenase I small subunit